MSSDRSALLTQEGETIESSAYAASEPVGFARGIARPIASGLTIGIIVSTWPRLSQTFVLREVLGLERLGLRLRIFSVKVPTDEPVHEEVAQVRAPITYLAFRSSWKPIVNANLRVARELGGQYFRTLFMGLRCVRYGNVLHILRQFLRGAYVADILRREPVDHMHAHFATAPATVAMFASELSGTPYTIAVHANDIFVKARGRLLRAKIERAEAVVANNEHNRQYLMSRFGTLLDGKLPCIYNGLDLSQFNFRWPRAADAGPPLVLAVGRLVEKKGFEDLVSAVKILRQHCSRGDAATRYTVAVSEFGKKIWWEKPSAASESQDCPFRLEIIGSGPLKDRIRAQIRQLDLGDCISLVGAKDQQVVRAAYQRAALFVLPCIITSDGDRDGIPNVLYEAMASGTPVISTRVSAIPELVQSEHNGLLVNPGDPAMLAASMQRLLLDPGLRDRLARAARDTIETRFTLERTSRELFELFEKLQRERTSPATSTAERKYLSETR
jgi:glycosyltransferase involved in cell wall biosynthesis